MVPTPDAGPAVTLGSRPPPQLGLMVNLGQFALLVGMNGLVGAMVGQERTLVPLIASKSFAIATVTAALSFLVAFGLAKAFTNLLAGALADRYGRRPVLFWGWVIALPVPLLLALSPTWAGVIAANALLGVSQGLTWSMTVLMKIDLVGPRMRGLALGLNEAAGYVAVGLSALTTGLVAEHLGLRPAPFLIGLAICGLG
ncbi:MAG: MFS transporter, partial [Candidatus Limnocylindrales bacterium]